MKRRTRRWIFWFSAIGICLTLAAAITLLPSLASGENEFLNSLLGGSPPTRPEQKAPEPVVPAEPMPDDVVVLRQSDRLKGGAESLLLRELARQAILIAARDELGLRTRDASLREVTLDADMQGLGAIRPIIMSPRDGRDGRMIVNFSRTGEKAEDSGQVVIERGDGDRYAHLAKELEAHSRGQFVNVLQGIGFKRVDPNRDNGADPVVDPEPDLCDRFHLISQYAAARGWHEAIQTNGETPERLSGLVLAYANLGLLTADHWSPAYKAYHARSLLYAERLLHRTGETALSLQIRAYARALTGFPAAAMEDLERANSLMAADATPLKFVAVLKAYCRGQEQQLTQLANEKTGAVQMLSLLLLLSDAELTASIPLTESIAQRILRIDPACNRALDALLSDKMPASILAEAQRQSAEAATEWLYAPLASSHLPLPVKVGAVSSTPETEAEFRRRMVATLIRDRYFRRDTSEPSLVALGRLIEEEGFLQSMRSVYADLTIIGRDPDDRIAQTVPWAWHHPFRCYIDNLVIEREAGTPFRDATIAQLGRETLIPAYDPAHQIFTLNVPEHRDEAKELFWRNCDSTLFDLVWLAKQARTPVDRRRYVRRLQTIAPTRPVTAALLMAYDPDRAVEYLTDWEQRFGENATIMKGLGDLHFELLNQEESIRCYKRAFEASPTTEIGIQLANAYYGFGDEENYLQTLQDSLEYPSKNNEREVVCEKIAYLHMRRGHFGQALPYATQAAERKSISGLKCAADCYEGLGDFESAERMLRDLSERYWDFEPAEWYLWCLRTGRGDAAAASAQAEHTLSFLRNERIVYGVDQTPKLILLAQAEGRLRDALTLAETQAQQDGSPELWLRAALLADELDDEELRNRFLSGAVTSDVQIPLHIAYLIEAFNAELSGQPLDVEKLKKDITLILSERGAATNAYYWVGQFLWNRGREKDALELFDLAATSPYTESHGRILAAVTLRRLGHSYGAQRHHEIDEQADFACDRSVDAQRYLSQGRYLAALRHAEKALRLIADHKVARLIKAHALAGQKRTDEAIVAYDQIYTQMSQQSECLLYASMLKEHIGDHAGAISGYEVLIASNARPTVKGRAHLALAWLYAACLDESYRDSSAALQHAESAKASGLPEEEYLPACAASLAAAGRIDEATVIAEAIQPRHTGYRRYLLEEQLACYRDRQPYRRTDGWHELQERYVTTYAGYLNDQN